MGNHLDFANLGALSWISILFTGAGVGFLGGFAGIGGLPFMVALIRLPPLEICQHEAQGSVLAVMLPPMSALGVWVMRDRAKLVWKYAAVAFCCYSVTSFCGALLAYALDDFLLTLLFAIHMLVLCVYYCWQYLTRDKGDADADADDSEKDVEATDNPVGKGAGGDDNDVRLERDEPGTEDGTEPYTDYAGRSPDHPEFLDPDAISVKPDPYVPLNFVSIAVLGACIGVVGGFFGIGAGVLMVPFMTELMKIHKDDARTLSLMILLPPASAGAVIEYSSKDNVDWPLAACLFGLYFVTNPFGAKIGRDVDASFFKLVQAALFAGLGTALMVVSLMEVRSHCHVAV